MMMGTYEVVCGDVVEWARGYKGPAFHAVLSDPPYHLTTITKRFGKGGSAPAQYGTDGAFQRVSTGFMGQEWDGGDVAFRAETWEAIAGVLHAGAFGMAFGSTRGWHRLACAIEDAGNVIMPTIFGWLNGQSFPKAARIDTQLDRAAGVERPNKVTGGHYGYVRVAGNVSNEGATVYDSVVPHVIGKGSYAGNDPQTALARAWAGHRYGGQVLKNCLEPIVCWRKPYGGRPVESIVRTGAGALNVEAGRIGVSANDPNHRIDTGGYHSAESKAVVPNAPYNSTRSATLTQGRWPPNFCACHSPGCRRVGTRTVEGRTINRWAEGNGPFDRMAGHPYEGEYQGDEAVEEWVCVEGCAVRALGEQAGMRSTHSTGSHDLSDYGERGSIFRGNFGGKYDSDTGTAARFYPNCDWGAEECEWNAEVAERIVGANPVYYQAKVARREREDGLIGHIPCLKCGGLHTTEHLDDDGKIAQCHRNGHPSLKPISLNIWLAKLLLPPAEYAPRRLLVPFMGTGSEVIGTLLAGWDEVVGVEMQPEYVEIARARLAWWAANGEAWLAQREHKHSESRPSAVVSAVKAQPEARGSVPTPEVATPAVTPVDKGNGKATTQLTMADLLGPQSRGVTQAAGLAVGEYPYDPGADVAAEGAAR